MSAQQDTAFVELSRRFRPPLMAFFLRRIDNHAEAEDLTQEVFVRMSQVPSDKMAHPDAYIFQIAANLLRDKSRREKVRTEYRRGVMIADGTGIEPIDPHRVLEGRETLGQIATILRELPERTRTIFILYRVEFLKKREIATGLGISVSAVDKHLMKAMALMMDRLGSGS